MPDDIAKLLERYVPKAEFDQALDLINEVTEHNTKLAAEVKRLSARDTERGTRANRAAYDTLAKEFKVNLDFADEVFELSGLASEKAELEPDAIKAKLQPFLEAKPKFLAKEPPAPKPKQAAQQPTKPAAKPAAEPSQTELIAKRDGEFDYRPENLSDPEWCLHNGDAFAAAMIAGKANRISD